MVDRKINRVNSVTTPAGTATNVLEVRENFVMQHDIQFVPNTYEGIGLKQDHKWREITIIFDSDTDIFDNYIDDDGPNSPLASFRIDFTATVVATQVQFTERWTYTANKVYVMDRREGEVEEGRERQTFEYQLLAYDTKTISWI